MSNKELDMVVNIKLNFSWLDAIKLRLAGLKNTSMSEDPQTGQSAEEKRSVADGK